MTRSARRTVLAAWLALGGVLIPGAPQAAQEATLAASGRDPAQFPAYVEQLKRQAREQGISQSTLDRAFAQIHFVDRVIKADRNQPEQKVTLDDYLRRVMSPAKVRQGRELYRQRQAQWTRASERYRVPGRYIIALWGMESAYGKIQGGKTWCLRWRRWRLKGAARPFSVRS